MAIHTDFLTQVEAYYNSCRNAPERYKMAAVAFWETGEDQIFAPNLVSTNNLEHIGCLWDDAIRLFNREFPDLAPSVVFTSVWLSTSSLADVHELMICNVAKMFAVLAGQDRHFGVVETHKWGAIPSWFSWVDDSFSATEREVLKCAAGVTGQRETFTKAFNDIETNLQTIRARRCRSQFKRSRYF